ATAFYSENSHLWMAPQNTSTSPAGQSSQSLPAAPTISGAMAQRSDLFACVARRSGRCLPVLRRRAEPPAAGQPAVHFCKRPLLHLAAGSFVWTFWPASCPNLDRISARQTRTSSRAASAAASALLKSSAHRQSNENTARTAQGSLNLDCELCCSSEARCLLHNDTIVVLSGLLHFVGSWYRVQTACSGSGFQQSGGTTVKKEKRQGMLQKLLAASSATGGDRPLLLNNVWLYTQGGTVFIGGSALLTEAQLAMSADFKPVPLDQQERLLASLPSSTRRQVPCRLFLQFSLGPGSYSLRAVAGVAWLRGRKAPLGDADSAADQLLWPSGGSGDTGSAHWIEGRDLLYKDGLLYLDDLTPVLKGGRICLGQQEMQLEWLSGWSDESKVNGSQDSDFSAEEQQQQQIRPDGFIRSVTDSSTDLGESDLNHRLHLPAGVGRPLFAHPARPNAADSQRGRQELRRDGPGRTGASPILWPESGRPTRMTAGFPPPRIVGWPLMPRPSESGRQWAGWVDRQLDTATFEKARLTLNRGTLFYDIRQPSMPLVQLERSRESESLQRLQQLQAEPIDQAELRETENRQDYTEVNAGLGKGFPDKAAQQQQQHRQQQQHSSKSNSNISSSSSNISSSNQQQQHQAAATSATARFIGGYSVVANRQTDALIFNLKARFPDGLRFLF
uniref:RING-type domain-containing protein n=1 Tax=Macrostomum lignano TaxID=282301 RepID=A0A1I8HHH2_9PLAT